MKPPEGACQAGREAGPQVFAGQVRQFMAKRGVTVVYMPLGRILRQQNGGPEQTGHKGNRYLG